MLDNTAYNIKLSSMLKTKSPKLFTYGCICHKINLISKNLIKFIFLTVLDNINLIINYIRGSSLREEIFKKV